MASATPLALIEIKDKEIVLTIKKLGTPSYLKYLDDVHVFHLVMDVNTKHWYNDIYNYLKNQIVPDNYDRNERVRLKRTVINYVIIGEVLYIRSFDGALLRFLT